MSTMMACSAFACHRKPKGALSLVPECGSLVSQTVINFTSSPKVGPRAFHPHQCCYDNAPTPRAEPLQ
jgi:hypothetical protein